jgi:hypothetical protein
MQNEFKPRPLYSSAAEFYFTGAPADAVEPSEARAQVAS